MRFEKLKIKWSERLHLNKLRRLYESEAKGHLDVDLLEDVAVMLYLRCKDIIAVDRANRGEVRCPFCYEKNSDEIYILVQINETTHQWLDNLKCPRCGEEFLYSELRQCQRKKQLSIGAAGEAFRRFIREYERKAEPEARMLQIDRLIHEFHYALRTSPDCPTRSVGPNLLSATLTETMKFLDELSGINSNPDLKTNADEWQEKKKKFIEAFPSWKEKIL